jgi:hypothetical protein
VTEVEVTKRGLIGRFFGESSGEVGERTADLVEDEG